MMAVRGAARLCGRSGRLPADAVRSRFCNRRRAPLANPAANAARLASTPTPGMTDRVLERRARQRQSAGPRHRTQQHRTEMRAVRLGQRLHVRRDHMPRGGPAGGQQRLRIDAPVAHRDLLGHREHAVGGEDERAALGRHQAALDRAAGLHQFGRDHQIDIARHRHQRQHRLLAARIPPAERTPDNRSSRRCAAPRPAPMSIAR